MEREQILKVLTAVINSKFKVISDEELTYGEDPIIPYEEYEDVWEYFMSEMHNFSYPGNSFTLEEYGFENYHKLLKVPCDWFDDKEKFQGAIVTIDHTGNSCYMFDFSIIFGQGSDGCISLTNIDRWKQLEKNAKDLDLIFVEWNGSNFIHLTMYEEEEIKEDGIFKFPENVFAIKGYRFEEYDKKLIRSFETGEHDKALYNLLIPKLEELLEMKIDLEVLDERKIISALVEKLNFSSCVFNIQETLKYLERKLYEETRAN